MSITEAMAACIAPWCLRGNSPAKMADRAVVHPMPSGIMGNPANVNMMSFTEMVISKNPASVIMAPPSTTHPLPYWRTK